MWGSDIKQNSQTDINWFLAVDLLMHHTWPPRGCCEEPLVCLLSVFVKGVRGLKSVCYDVFIGCWCPHCPPLCQQMSHPLLLPVASGCFSLPPAPVHDVRAQNAPSTPSSSQLLIVNKLSLLSLSLLAVWGLSALSFFTSRLRQKCGCSLVRIFVPLILQ